MTAEHPSMPSGRHLLRHAIITSALSVIVVALMITAYLAVPEPAVGWDPWEFAVFGTLALLMYLGMIVAAIVRLFKSPRPLMEGVLFVIVMVALLVFAYAWMYLSMSLSQPGSFTEPLSKQSAVYFTVTVLSTVGFGDITPVLDVPRMVVTSQMLIGFTLFTLAIKVITSSTRRAIQRNRPEKSDHAHQAS
ncbi:MAG: ion channel [Candidatus Nanopelagicales bacterium]